MNMEMKKFKIDAFMIREIEAPDEETAIRIFLGNMACNAYGEFFKGYDVEAEEIIDEDE